MFLRRSNLFLLDKYVSVVKAEHVLYEELDSV